MFEKHWQLNNSSTGASWRRVKPASLAVIALKGIKGPVTQAKNREDDNLQCVVMKLNFF